MTQVMAQTRAGLCDHQTGNGLNTPILPVRFSDAGATIPKDSGCQDYCITYNICVDAKCL